MRLYCRDTATWKRLGFAGRSVLAHLLRVVDTDGAVDLGNGEPWELAVELFAAPEEMARQGMERVLALGVVEHRGCMLVVPNFVAAQRSPKAAAQRKRETRLRQRDKALHVTFRDGDASQIVTGLEDASTVSQNVTGLNGHGNRGVTGESSNHVTIRPVTPSHPDPSCPIESQNVTRSGYVTGLAPCEDEPSQTQSISTPPWVQLLKTWEKAAFNGMPSGEPTAHRTRLECLWAACLARDPADPVGVFRRAADAYVALQKAKRRNPQLRWFASDFETYVNVHRNGRSASPLLEELRRTEELYARALKEKDELQKARLQRRLEELGKRMSGHA